MSKISWSAALADYLKDETLSYALVAERYGVSLQAVKKRAGREKWQDLRQKSLLKVNQELPGLIAESIAEANARQAQMGKLLQAIGLRAMKEEHLKPETVSQAVQSIKTGIDIERKARGMDATQVSPSGYLQKMFNKSDVTW